VEISCEERLSGDIDKHGMQILVGDLRDGIKDEDCTLMQGRREWRIERCGDAVG